MFRYANVFDHLNEDRSGIVEITIPVESLAKIETESLMQIP